MGEVGTPEDSQFTYEEAVHHRRGRTDLVLHVGRNIPTEENAKLSYASGLTLKRLQTAVEESWRPMLPHGILPCGWDAWSRPCALIGCPAGKVPKIASNHGYHRVTVVVLLSFPPEPLYFPNVEHLDRSLQHRNKAGKRKAVCTGLELISPKMARKRM